MIVLWAALALLAGFAAGFGIMYLTARRVLLLLWPGDWLTSVRARRQVRGMSDPGDRIGS
jgi:hypothetical protein